MLPLLREDSFAFRFADSRRIERVHLEGIACGVGVRLAFADGREPFGILTVGEGGWVAFPGVLEVRAGDRFEVRLCPRPGLPL